MSPPASCILPPPRSLRGRHPPPRSASVLRGGRSGALAGKPVGKAAGPPCPPWPVPVATSRCRPGPSRRLPPLGPARARPAARAQRPGPAQPRPRRTGRSRRSAADWRPPAGRGPSGIRFKHLAPLLRLETCFSVLLLCETRKNRHPPGGVAVPPRGPVPPRPAPGADLNSTLWAAEAKVGRPSQSPRVPPPRAANGNAVFRRPFPPPAAAGSRAGLGGEVWRVRGAGTGARAASRLPQRPPAWRDEPGEGR